MYSTAAGMRIGKQEEEDEEKQEGKEKQAEKQEEEEEEKCVSQGAVSHNKS